MLSLSLKRLRLCLLFITLLPGCMTNIPWVSESQEIASCVPDSPPTWEDFTVKDWEGGHSAQTSVQFIILSRNPPRLQARLDRTNSLVKPRIAQAWFPYDRELRQRLLRHEQLHFALSCLLTRQANATLQADTDLDRMLLLLRATAQRLNLEYDSDTNHGTRPHHQARWEVDVTQQWDSFPTKTID